MIMHWVKTVTIVTALFALVVPAFLVWLLFAVGELACGAIYIITDRRERAVREP